MAQYDINFSTNASQIAKELSKVQTELAKTVQAAKPGGLKIKLSLDTADFTRAEELAESFILSEENNFGPKLLNEDN
jgi:hypothetical protein